VKELFRKTPSKKPPFSSFRSPRLGQRAVVKELFRKTPSKKPPFSSFRSPRLGQRAVVKELFRKTPSKKPPRSLRSFIVVAFCSFAKKVVCYLSKEEKRLALGI